jgi:hypothetical protein
VVAALAQDGLNPVFPGSRPGRNDFGLARDRPEAQWPRNARKRQYEDGTVEPAESPRRGKDGVASIRTGAGSSAPPASVRRGGTARRGARHLAGMKRLTLRGGPLIAAEPVALGGMIDARAVARGGPDSLSDGMAGLGA